MSAHPEEPDRPDPWRPRPTPVGRWPFARAAASLLIGLSIAVSWETASHGQIQVFFNKLFVAYNTDGDAHCAGGVNNDPSSMEPQPETLPQTFSVSHVGLPPQVQGANRPARIEFSPQTTGALTSALATRSYPGSCLALCVQLGYNNETGANIPIDTMVMEVFKFLPGSNPSD